MQNVSPTLSSLLCRILLVCHDGGLYGSQQSLSLMVRHLSLERYRCFVSIARPGPLGAMLEKLPHVTVLSHRRLQWVKHDPRSLLQRVGDVVSLLVVALPRAMALSRVIRREKIDVVHTNATVSLEGALAARLAGVPHIWHIRELWMEKSPKFHLTLGRRVSRWLIDRLSDRVLCISEAVRRQFGRYADENPQRYQLLYNAVEMAHPEMPSDALQAWRERMRLEWLEYLGLPETDRFRMGYIGRLSEGKGFHFLLEALCRLKERGVPAELVVAGNFVDAPYEARIRQMVAENDLAAWIRFLGYKEDVTPLYGVVDALAVPSLNEPFGRVVIEAMMHGAPCVAAESGGIPELIDHGVTGLLYPPNHPEELADRLEQLIVSPVLAETLRRNARQSVYPRFQIETQIRILEECYQSVMNRHQP